MARFLAASLVLSALFAGGVSQGRPIEFADGFEGDSLDPFWTVVERSGSVSLSGDDRHGGARSARFDSVANGQDKMIWLMHTFDAPVFGRVSVWVRDTGADVWSSNYIGIYVANYAMGKSTHIGTSDYDLGQGQEGSWYYYNPTGEVSVSTGIDRTDAWHRYEIETTPTSLTISLDGVVVYSGAEGYPFDALHLTLGGPSWRPAFTTYFDDFEFVEYSQECRADFNGDGVLNVFDFLAFQTAFGDGCP